MLKLKQDTWIDISSSYPFLIIFCFMLLTNLFIQLYFDYYLGMDKVFVAYLYIFSLVPFLALFHYYKRKGAMKFEDIGFTKKKWKTNLILGSVIGILTGLLGWLLLFLLNIEPSTIPEGQGLTIFILLFPTVCISAPVWEEIGFRGLFLTFMEKISYSKFNSSKNVKTALIVILVSLAFLVAHSEREPKGLFVIFVTSIIYTVAYLKTRSIIVPIFAHSLYNLFVLLRPYIL